MKDFRTNITRRIISQKNREGKVLEYVRYILHYKDPATNTVDSAAFYSLKIK